MGKLKLYLILAVTVALCGMTGVYGQESGPAHTVAEETLQVDASSATVLQWFHRIEREKRIVLSYNASLIDLNRVIRVEKARRMTVAELLEVVLDGYVFKTAFIPPRKLVIQVREKENFYVSGTVFEDGSKERLYGAVVSLEDGKGKQWNCISDGNGVFKLYAPEGTYRFTVSYMGYSPFNRQVRVDKDRFVTAQLQPLSFEMEEVTVESEKRSEELGELTPSNMLAFSGNDLFAQIWILPGVTSSMAGSNFQVDGGSSDENQFLLDGVPVFHPGHINSLLPAFNGDAVKNMVFHKGFFDTHLEGRLSSVTEVNLKEGNKQKHVGTLTLDMPAASATLEGPIIKNKLSYMVSARRSWLDFFDRLFSEDNRLNHASYDYNAKLSYSFSPVSSLSFLAYGARDDYHLPLLSEDENTSVLRWENQVYQLTYQTQAGKLGNRTSLFYSSHSNRARSEMLGVEGDGYIRSGNGQRIDGVRLYVREYLPCAVGSQILARGVRPCLVRRTGGPSPRTGDSGIALLRQPCAHHAPPLGTDRRSRRSLPAPQPPLVLQHPATHVAKILPGRKRPAVPQLLEDGAVLPLPEAVQLGHAYRFPHAQHRRVQAAHIGTLRGGMEAFPEQRDAGGIGLLQDTAQRGCPASGGVRGRRTVGRVYHGGKRRQLRSEDVLLQGLEAMEAATVVHVRTDAGMVSRTGGQRQDAFAVRHTAPAECRSVVPVECPFALLRGRHDALGQGHRPRRELRPAARLGVQTAPPADELPDRRGLFLPESIRRETPFAAFRAVQRTGKSTRRGCAELLLRTLEEQLPALCGHQFPLLVQVQTLRTHFMRAAHSRHTPFTM